MNMLLQMNQTFIEAPSGCLEDSGSSENRSGISFHVFLFFFQSGVGVYKCPVAWPVVKPILCIYGYIKSIIINFFFYCLDFLL